jgi:hypothetical protein
MMSRFAATVDMSGATELAITVTVCDPSGWLVHITDSSTGNGGGGDAATSSNDAEAQLMDRALTVFSNQDHPSGPATALHSDASYVLASGCTTFTWIVRDQFFGSTHQSVSVSSPHLLRIDPPSDSEGTPDSLWYVGLNRTYGTSMRNGTGVTMASFCVQ